MAGKRTGSIHSPEGHAPLHPIVAAFAANPEPLGRAISFPPDARDPAVRALGSLCEALQRRRSYAEVRAGLENLDLSECDPDLRVLLLIVWVLAAHHLTDQATEEQADEVRALTRMARSLLTRRAPPELRAELLGIEALTSNVRGNLASRDRLLEEARDALAPSSPRYVHGALNCLWNHAIHGRLIEHRDELEVMRDRPDLQMMLQVFEFADAVEAGRVAEAVNLEQTLGKPWEPTWEIRPQAKHRATYRWLRAALGFLRGDPSLEGAYWAVGFADPNDFEYLGPDMQLDKLPVWVQVWHHLLGRRPEEALVYARREASDWGPSYYTSLGAMPLNLARCELACGHAEAAHQILERRRRLGNVRYLDGLFWARLALLTGEREAAARHFAEASALAGRYGAEGRLNFELQMACELSPTDLLWLGRATVGKARGAAAAARESKAEPSTEVRGLERLVGASRALVTVREAVLRLGPLDVPVLITGETGTGKELVARAIHEVGPRAAGPFLAINCGAIAESLLESELFGHEKGAFTGAAAAHRGLFEEAGEGTILLDEIGEIPARLQVALLRVLESGEIRPVGAGRPRRIACRILAATNADLATLAGEGRFRADLVYRLQRLQVHLPPLRERPDDVLPLAEHFLAEGRQDGLRPTLAADAQRWLRAEKWPGNVRELRNAIERLRLLNSDKLSYDLGDLEAQKTATGAAPPPPAEAPKPGGAVASTAGASGAKGELFADSRGPMRQLERLRELFGLHRKLTRGEVMKLLGVSHATATRYLRELCREGLVEKVMPSGSPRTHYFRLRG